MFFLMWKTSNESLDYKIVIGGYNFATWHTLMTLLLVPKSAMLLCGHKTRNENKCGSWRQAVETKCIMCLYNTTQT